ncbi:MAG TPA: BatD family protein [Chthoniobacterales bacterium]|nr:BatD family protein [Chthoniobacterales bacterium]
MRHSSQTVFLSWAILLSLAGMSLAAPSVTAVLSNSEVMVGEMVQLEIRLTEGGSAVVPKDIVVDGLEIHQTGRSQQFEMRDFKTTSSVTYSYTVLPLKAGTYKIPSQRVHVGGTDLQTPELTLRVTDAVGRQNAPNTAGQNSAAGGKLAFAELIIPKKTAYVGEMIPVVVRLCFATRAKLTDLPEITAQGFTMQKLQVPDQPSHETMNGRNWEVFTFKTAIAPTRSGKFEIGPVRATALVAVPRRPQQGSSRSRSPFDIFNLDDPFLSDPFFRDPFGSMTQQQRIPISSEPITLEVKALPGNAPPSFTGAVGNFTMSTEAKPKTVQVGDPITITSTIAGRGNFDRMNAPTLEDESGWHKYPPSATFKQDDDVGISGQKTFETVISPNERKSAIPPVAFSYFDPVKEQYLTLRSDPTPIRVEGGAVAAAASPPPKQTTAPTGPGTSPATTAATPPPRDILYQLSEIPAEQASFTPLYAQRAFWIAQLVPLLALAGFAGWKIRRARLQNRDAHRIAALQHELSDLTRKLRRSDATPDEYFPHASRLVQVKTALARNLDPNAVDMETAARVFDLDDAERAQLRQIFEHSDELRYSGGGNGHTPISEDQRRAVLRFIEGLRA